jgi:cytidylate kinase
MGRQAPDMALDNEIEVDAHVKVFVESRVQQRALKRAIEFEATKRKEKGLPGHKV